MAQAQLDFAENISFVDNIDFDKITWTPTRKIITCTLCNGYVLLLKRKRHQIKICLKKGTKEMNIPFVIFETLCDLKESLQLLASFLEGN